MISTNKGLINHIAVLLLTVSVLFIAACQPVSNSNSSPTASPTPSASPSATPIGVGAVLPVTLPVLDALFSDEAFNAKLKAQVSLTDDQIAQLKKISGDEVSRLRELNAEEQSGSAEESRARASDAIRNVVGEAKVQPLFAFVSDYWIRGGENGDAKTGLTANAPAAGPNAVPTDTRVVVNIPAYRMDVFREGSLVKSYKIGIGVPEFPLPTGLRKAQTIIFNPTWTPPDEPWVAKMKGVAVGEKVAAGSKLNPLGPIKIPIGLPSLIHGGKSPAKLGTFASHGCVGLTTPQVQDFSKLLAQIAGDELSDSDLQGYLKDKTKTQTVKLDQAVPVELRYETIVVEDGKLKIYRDVYDHDSNNEENLRAVLSANGVRMEDLTEDERARVMDALNAMSRTPQKAAATKPSPDASPTDAKKKPTQTKARKPIGKNQKEVVIEIAALKGKGYPVAVNFDTGSGKPAGTVAVARPASEPSPKVR